MCRQQGGQDGLELDPILVAMPPDYGIGETIDIPEELKEALRVDDDYRMPVLDQFTKALASYCPKADKGM